MNNKLIAVTIFLSITGLNGCSKTPSQDEIRLKEIAANTQTTEKQRTIEWYQKNDFVRNDVISTCMNIMENKIQEANSFGGDVKYEEIDKQVNNNPDCLNARQANINIEAALDKSRITYDEYNRRLNQYSDEKTNEVLTIEERKKAQEYLSEAMNNMDDHAVARQGEDQFKKLKNMVESDQ